jgi:hypothetical protein
VKAAMAITAPTLLTAPATFKIMSEDFGKITAIASVGLRLSNTLVQTTFDCGGQQYFYHNGIRCATGVKILV